MSIPAFIEDTKAMKSFAWSAAMIVSCMLFGWGWSRAYGGEDSVDARSGVSISVPAPAEAKPKRVGQSPMQGLSKHDRAIFFHMAEGSELIPLAWVRALKSTKTSRP